MSRSVNIHLNVFELMALGYSTTLPQLYTLGQLHNITDKQGIYITVDGDKHYYLNNQLHRTDGPAIEYADGDKYYYHNNQLHRIDGPAIEYADGRKAYYQNGKDTEPTALR